jgi:hypothetical protein
MTWVTLISHILLPVVPVKAKAREAVSAAAAPISRYTEEEEKVDYN